MFIRYDNKSISKIFFGSIIVFWTCIVTDGCIVVRHVPRTPLAAVYSLPFTVTWLRKPATGVSFKITIHTDLVIRGVNCGGNWGAGEAATAVSTDMRGDKL